MTGSSIAIFAFYSRVEAKDWPKPAIISAAFPPGFEMEEDGQETLLQRQDLGRGTMAWRAITRVLFSKDRVV